MEEFNFCIQYSKRFTATEGANLYANENDNLMLLINIVAVTAKDREIFALTLLKNFFAC